jgi:transposase
LEAPWAILEDELDCMLVNARHGKQVPGRKTDVSDAAWLCQLAESGLLRANFVPPKPIRQLRNLTRYRKTQIQERAREGNRLHKALEDAGIKLDTVAADILGKSGRDRLDALVAGETDPNVLADLARRQMRKKIPALREALAGHVDAHHRLWIGAILRHVDFLDEQIEQLTGMIEEQIRPFAPAVELLCTVVGNKHRGPECNIGQIGTDISCFATARHLAARARRATDPSGWTSRSSRPPWPPSASRVTTSKPNTGGSSLGAAISERSAPSSTR